MCVKEKVKEGYILCSKAEKKNHAKANHAKSDYYATLVYRAVYFLAIFTVRHKNA